MINHLLDKLTDKTESSHVLFQEQGCIEVALTEVTDSLTEDVT